MSMRRMLIGAICLAAAGLPRAHAETRSVPPNSEQAAPADKGTTSAPDGPAETSAPDNGVVHPAPNATHDTEVKPPNVDPGMAIAPPGTPGSGVNVTPK
jgi:hypothetical protein